MSCRRDNHVTTEKYRGYEIEVYYDLNAQNPFEEWDCEPPIAVYYDRGIREHATKYGHVNSVPPLTGLQLELNHDEICEFLNADNLSEFDSDTENFDENVNDAIREEIDGEYESKRLERLAEVYRWAGITARYSQVTGCSQSDWAYVLAVATPKFLEAMGSNAEAWDRDKENPLEASIQLYEDWAFGNVYGFEIKDADGEDLASCWGFYGDYDGDMLDECRSTIDYDIQRKQTKHYKQLKLWIRNRVPQIYRSPLAIRT